MKKVNVEIVRLTGDDAINYNCTEKQIYYIRNLMEKRGLIEDFNKHFTINGKVICNHLTKAGAKKLIDGLKLLNTEIVFITKNS